MTIITALGNGAGVHSNEPLALFSGREGANDCLADVAGADRGDSWLWAPAPPFPFPCVPRICLHGTYSARPPPFHAPLWRPNVCPHAPRRLVPPAALGCKRRAGWGSRGPPAPALPPPCRRCPIASSHRTLSPVPLMIIPRQTAVPPPHPVPLPPRPQCPDRQPSSMPAVASTQQRAPERAPPPPPPATKPRPRNPTQLLLPVVPHRPTVFVRFYSAHCYYNQCGRPQRTQTARAALLVGPAMVRCRSHARRSRRGRRGSCLSGGLAHHAQPRSNRCRGLTALACRP